VHFLRFVFFLIVRTLLACGIVSAEQKPRLLISIGSPALKFPISAVVAIQDLDKAGLVARAIQSGRESLEAMRTLTCHQRVDVYEHGKFRDSNEFDVNFHNGSEHYSNFIRAGHPRDVSSEDEVTLHNLYEYFRPPWSIGEYARFLQDALNRMKTVSDGGEMRAKSNELSLICIDVRHPTPDFWVFSDKHYYDLPYRLTVFIDPVTAKIRRIVQARCAFDGMPANLWYVDYRFEAINGKRYWVPVSGGFEGTGRDRDLFRNKVSFSEYREFTVGSRILFAR
jgi:hypothetical protein